MRKADCTLSSMWTEVQDHFPDAVFLSWRDSTLESYARLKFLPNNISDLADTVTLLFDGVRYWYLVGLDSILNVESWRCI